MFTRRFLKYCGSLLGDCLLAQFEKSHLQISMMSSVSFFVVFGLFYHLPEKGFYGKSCLGVVKTITIFCLVGDKINKKSHRHSLKEGHESDVERPEYHYS